MGWSGMTSAGGNCRRGLPRGAGVTVATRLGISKQESHIVAWSELSPQVYQSERQLNQRITSYL